MVKITVIVIHLVLASSVFASPVFAFGDVKKKEIKTNEVVMADAPAWLTQTRVEAVTARIANKLEWTIRRVPVKWYSETSQFEKAHSLGPFAMAVTVGTPAGAVIHLGPLVTNAEFDETFGHELVHVVILQKYRGAIPKWLEEGLANHVAKHVKIDYAWLAKQPFPKDVRELAHPMLGAATGIRYRYKASQALAEMLDKACNLENLVRLSVKRNMEDYIKTYCEIPDLNVAFRSWVMKQAGKSTAATD